MEFFRCTHVLARTLLPDRGNRPGAGRAIWWHGAAVVEFGPGGAACPTVVLFPIRKGSTRRHANLLMVARKPMTQISH